jgi:hypothetical protein
VERGDYQVLRAEDSQMINRSEFARMVEPGMLLEMTIVMRQNTAFHENKGKCPRCRHMNLNATITNGWIEWHVSVQFLYAHNLLTQSPTAANVQDNSRSQKLT